MLKINKRRIEKRRERVKVRHVQISGSRDTKKDTVNSPIINNVEKKDSLSTIRKQSSGCGGCGRH